MILGSKSPRRAEILSLLGIPFVIEGSSFDERSVLFEEFATDYVQTIAVEKSAPLSKKFPDELILTADTTVHLKGQIFNKPLSYTEAFEMLSILSNQEHEVVTGVCIRKNDTVHVGAEVTKVLFNPLDEKQIRSYIKNINVLDKAGGYAIQGVGSLLVRSITGCFYNVMGLPLNTTRDLLAKMHIDIWQYLSY